MQKRLLQLFILVLIVSSMAVVSVMADDDETRNACDVGGTLEGQCETEWEWIAGWYLIRYEEGVFTMADIPGWVNAILPQAHDPNSGFVSGFDFNDPSNPNTGNFGNGDATNNVGGGTGSGTGGGTGGGTPPPSLPADCTINIAANLASAWGTAEQHTATGAFLAGQTMSSGDLGWAYSAGYGTPGDYMYQAPYWYIKLTMPAGWTTIYTFDTSYNGQPRWTGDGADNDCEAPTPPQQVP